MTDWLDKCHFGDVRMLLGRMWAAGVKVNTIVTSPPYWGLRSYLPADHPDKAHELGSEPTLREFIETMTGVLMLAREVLADDGTMWLNMGDSYASNAGGYTDTGSRGTTSCPRISAGTMAAVQKGKGRKPGEGFKPKDLMMQPHRLAIALQEAGWYVRQDIVWSKPNPMPESTRDRCTKAHEYLFLLAKSERYYYDFDAVQEPVNGGAHARRSLENSNLKRPGFGLGYDAEPRPRYKTPDGWATHPGAHGSFRKDGLEKGFLPEVGRREGPPGNPAESKYGLLSGQDADGPHRTKAGLNRPKGSLDANDSAYGDGKSTRMGRGAGWRKLAEAGSSTKNNESMDDALEEMRNTRNRRSVWTVASEPYKGAHFAAFPTKLITHCILAGCPPGGTVLDIFMGSGTTAQVAQELGRRWIGIDLDVRNKALQDERLRQRSIDLDAA
jgi:site-specific DNA-methyltransferase (cytosine-N4-specific)